MPKIRPNMRTILARNVKVLREMRQWDQNELARAANISQKTVSNIENVNSGVKSPQLDIIERIAAAFDMETFQLIVPDLPEELLKNKELERLNGLYVHLPQEGRSHILNTAERETKYTVKK